MDLGTVKRKLEEGEYGSDHEGFKSDVVLVFDNAIDYNKDNEEVWLSPLFCRCNCCFSLAQDCT